MKVSNKDSLVRKLSMKRLGYGNLLDSRDLSTYLPERTYLLRKSQQQPKKSSPKSLKNALQSHKNVWLLLGPSVDCPKNRQSLKSHASEGQFYFLGLKNNETTRMILIWGILEYDFSNFVYFWDSLTIWLSSLYYYKIIILLRAFQKVMDWKSKDHECNERCVICIFAIPFQ